jgi:prevent-host-death family protein
MAQKKTKYETIAVSELKNKLLEIVRQVEKGSGFRITKGGQVVAALVPHASEEDPVVGFASITIKGDLLMPTTDPDEWSADIKNL